MTFLDLVKLSVGSEILESGVAAAEACGTNPKVVSVMPQSTTLQALAFRNHQTYSDSYGTTKKGMQTHVSIPQKSPSPRVKAAIMEFCN